MWYDSILEITAGNPNKVIGSLAALASLGISLYGLPSQILKNIREQRGDSLSPSLVYASCCTYSLWSLYAWTKPTVDWFLAIPQSVGAIGAFILLAQMLFTYPKKEGP